MPQSPSVWRSHVGRALIVVLVLAAAGFLVWQASRPDAIVVTVGDVDRGRVERSVANTRAGTVNACRRAKLAPPAGGQIVTLNVRAGDRVRRDDVLVELWNDDASAQVRAAGEQARTAALRAEEACLQADVARRDAERAKRLYEQQLLSHELYDRATSTAGALRAGCEAANAEMQRARDQLALARASLTRTVLRAPFDGVVAEVNGELGEYATPSPPGIPTLPLVDLIDDSCLYVTAPIDEIDVARVGVGQAAHVTLEALPGVRIQGRVRRVAPYVLELEKQARTVDIEVELVEPGAAGPLLVGYSADVEIVLDVRDHAVRVPTQALTEGNRVFVRDARTGRLEERRVEAGISNWDFTEVLSGLTPGDRVVLSVEREGVAAGARTVEEPAARR
jgi:HlyD family secretion protein